MKVRIVKVILKNFKKIKFLEIDFGEVSYILGNNGTGKTTILDGIWWILFNKDSKGRKSFELKTLDEEGNQIHGLEHSVILHLSIDGAIIELKKVLKEKWTKKKGEAQRIFTGHETTYFINGVPITSEGFKDKLSEIIEEERFKEITNPAYFTTLHWTVQRVKIGELVNKVPNEEVIKSNPNLILLLEDLKRLEVDEYRKQLKVEGDGYKNEILKIQPKIDECNNQIIVDDFIGLRKTRVDLNTKLENLKEDETERGDFLIKKNRILTQMTMLKDILMKIDYENKNNGKLNGEVEKLNEIIQKINKINLNKDLENERIIISNKREKELETSLKAYNASQTYLRERWEEENSKIFQFNCEDKCCPTCNREYDKETLEELIKDGEVAFEKQKDKKLELINREGKNNKILIEEIGKKLLKEKSVLEEIEVKIYNYDEELRTLELEKREGEESIKALEEGCESSNKKEEFLEKYRVYENELNKIVEREPKDNRKEIKEIEEEIRAVDIKLLREERNKELNERIKELQEEERGLSESLAEVEKMDFLCEEFIRTKVRIIEKRFNGKFKNIRFKLFKELINGSIVECCECTSNGVPFSSLNTVAQINCGIEIIKALSEHYNITAPLFIDNRECINEIVESGAQVINFKVTRDEKIMVQKEEGPLLVEKVENKERKIEF